MDTHGAIVFPTKEEAAQLMMLAASLGFQPTAEPAESDEPATDDEGPWLGYL